MAKLSKIFLLCFSSILCNHILIGQPFTVVQTSTISSTIDPNLCYSSNLGSGGYPSQNSYYPCDDIIAYITLHNFTSNLTFRYITRTFENGVLIDEFIWPYVGHPNHPSGWVTHNIGSNSWHCNSQENSIGNYNIEFFIEEQSGTQTLCGSWNYSVAQHPDYAPLMALYNSTNGPGWTNKTGWIDGAAGTNCDPCNGWYGVTCTNGRVTCLDLDGSPTCNAGFSSGGNNLSGQLPSLLTNLVFLENLFLSNNPLGGIIPSEFGDFPNLRILLLQWNSLSGSIPDNLGNCNSLTDLWIVGNPALSGQIPSSLGNLTNLNQLGLGVNNLSGEIPASLGNLTVNLLWLQQNNLSGCIPEELQNLCSTVTNGNISSNPLLSTQSWANFCSNQQGMCIDCPGFTFEITGPTAVCTGGSVTLDAGSYSEYLWSNGATTQTINLSNITTSTTYNVTVTDSNGCTGTDSHTVNVNANPVPSITGAITACVGESVTLDAGSGYASYGWNTGESSPSIIVSPSGPATYTVTVTDVNGCTGFDAHTISTNPLNSYQFLGGTNQTCPGQFITISWATMGVTGVNVIDIPSGLTASFSGSSTSGTITVQGITFETGFHTITLDPQGGCPIGPIFHPLEVFDLPQVTIDAQEFSGWDFTDASICPTNQITLTAYGGISYQWSPSIQNGIAFTPSATDTYSVTVTDINNCTATDEILVTVFDPITYTFDPSNLKICQDTLITLNSPDLDNFSLVNMVARSGLSAVSTWNELSISPAQSTCTNCAFDLYITDGNNCSIQSSHTLTFSKSIVESTTQVSTQGGSDGTARIQMLNGSRPYTVRVNNGNPQVYQNTPFTIPNLTEGSYNLVVTDFDGCTSTASFVINGIDCPMTVSDSIEHIACYGDSVGRILLTVTGNDGNVTYSWQNNLGTSNILDSLKFGIYRVTLSDDNCSIIKSYTVSQPIKPLSLNASLTHPGCGISDGSITINAIGGWMPYDIIHPDTMLINQKAGVYSFYVMDSLGCRFDTTFALLVTPGSGDFPVFKNSPQDYTISCANAPLPDYMPTLAFGYPTCGLDSVGFVSASVTKVGDMCSGQTITYVWEYTDAFGHTITHKQRIQILPAPTPTFISPPGDVTINYSNLAQTLQPDTLSYSNNETGDCMVAGIAMPIIDSSGLMDCRGIVTRTWKAMFCNNVDSIMYLQNITVEKDDIPAPIVSCASSNENSITFGWTSVPEATGYNVDVISPVGLQGMMIGGQNQYQFSGLAIGQIVTIQIEAIIPGGCGKVLSLPHSCTALDCGPLPDVLIDIPMSFCVSDQPFTLNASQVTINPPIQNSTGSFEINGVAATQINPAQLGQGVDTITYRLTWNNGQCSQVGARTFEIYPVPSADFTISSLNGCLSDTVKVAYTGNAAGTTFTWDFGSDVIGSFIGPGPHQVRWANPGSKTITLSVSKNGCISSTIDKIVIVNPPLLPPVITCVDQKIDGVTFGWNPVNGANSYDIRVNIVNGATLYQGNVTNTTYEVTGLQEGTQVQISVTAKSNNACPDANAQSICVAESCPNARLTLPERNISTCLSPSSSPIPLVFTITDTIADISPIIHWTSNNTNVNNAINNNAIPPTFDPLIAGVGEYFVNLSYQQKSCIWEDSILISIKAKPNTTSIISKDSICISDTLELNTSSSSIPQLWSSSGAILSGQSSALCQVKFSNPGMNNVQLSYSNGTCTSDTLTKAIFVAPEQKAPEIQCETIGNTILFTWQDIECTKSYEVWRDGEIIQSSTQNEYLAASIKKGETIEISLITNSNCSCPIPATAKSCTLDENDDCDMELRDDYYSIVINQPYSFDILLNDFIPYDSFTVNILEYDDDYIKDLQFRESLEATVFKPFFDTLTIKYEVCTPDCNECNQAAVKITNEVLKDIILTNIILPNSSGNNATLRFTKDEVLEDSELYIFNRNGDKIFHKVNYDNTWNADGYPGGIYFYVLRYKGVDIKKTLTVMK